MVKKRVSKKRVSKKNVKTGGKKKPKKYSIKTFDGLKRLKCETDSYDKFYKKKVTVNSGRWSTFFELDWLFDKSATMLICASCSTIKWIKNKSSLVEE